MTRLIDLSHAIEDGMVTYPGLPSPRITDHLSREDSRTVYAEGTEFNIGRVDMVANTGTYLDTPFHRYADGYDLAGLPLDRVVDLPGVCVAVIDQEVGPEVLSGLDLADKAVLFATGWDRHWGSPSYGYPSHPYLSEAMADLLATSRVGLVGIDSVNIDDTRGGSRPVHTRLLEAGIPIVEHLTGLEVLVGESFSFTAVPPPVRGMGTFPVRAFAVI